MKSVDLRAKFLAFFEAKDHIILPSHSLIPDNDKTLLWINAGVAPLKKYFSKQVAPPSNRLASCQKSLRTNDIENVGKTNRHHTMFEMLGNFSIDGYFKKEAIAYAWEFLVEEVGLDSEKLFITVHPDDDEAKTIWHKDIGIPQTRIFDDPGNFWEIGPGPCGPNSEIYFDRGGDCRIGSDNCSPLCECGRFIEIWNLVFTQYNREEDGGLTKLPYNNIDTGMGLERLASVVQGTESNFETDLFMPIIEKTEQMSGKPYSENIEAMRVIADHVRSVSFTIADGALPSNEGRGYVIRRILRRAVRYGQSLGLKEAFLYKLVPIVSEIMGAYYESLAQKVDLIQRVIKSEEERFLRTLDEGEKLLAEYLQAAGMLENRVLAGDAAFRLYDTYGFPFELTLEIASEHDIEVDEKGFNLAMEEQRQRAREHSKVEKGNIVATEHFAGVAGGDVFVGYDTVGTEAVIIAIEEIAAEEVEFLLDKTPFYAESGGQIADIGQVSGDFGRLEIVDVTELADGKILHRARVEEGLLRVGDKVYAEVDEKRRQLITLHHSATHLLHRALKDVLGEHINQAGSLVSYDRLRFDFSHFAAPTAEELQKVAEIVNEKIYQALSVSWEEMPLAEATAKGATALFGEKYDSEVRVVAAGDYSLELCGGTHVHNTAEIGFFHILSEGSIGSGIRRIEAVVGPVAHAYLLAVESDYLKIRDILKSGQIDPVIKAEELVTNISTLEKENKELQEKIYGYLSDELLANSKQIKDFRLISTVVKAKDMEDLKTLGDILKNKDNRLVIVLGTSEGDKVSLLTVVSPDLIKEYGLKAGNIIKEIATICGGGGGGRPEMAQAGGKLPEKLQEALAAAESIVKAQI